MILSKGHPYNSVFSIWKSLSVTKSSHQNCGPCYLNLPILSYTYTLLFCWENKVVAIAVSQIRPLTTVQLCILQDYSSGRIVLNMNHKRHTLSIYVKFQSFLIYSELNELCGNHVWILKQVNLHCNWINFIRVLSFFKQ